MISHLIFKLVSKEDLYVLLVDIALMNNIWTNDLRTVEWSFVFLLLLLPENIRNVCTARQE
jgi:hypothetical protein